MEAEEPELRTACLLTPPHPADRFLCRLPPAQGLGTKSIRSTSAVRFCGGRPLDILACLGEPKPK